MAIKPEVMIKNEEDVRVLSGETFFKRGFNYYMDGAVQDLLETGGMVKAIVAGTHDYHVSFGLKRRQFHYDCDCPVGQDGLFCKHLVAAALALLAQQEEPAAGKRKSKTANKTDPIKTIKDHLNNSVKDQLIDIIIEQAENDPALRNQLLSKALRSQTVTDIANHKAFIRNALQARGFIDYRGMYRYIQKAWPAVNLLEGLLKDGHAAPVCELAAYALQLGFTAYNHVDDSDGSLGDILQAIAGLHLEACMQTQPEPKALAKMLFKLEMNDDWGIAHFEQYEPVLGKAGVQQFKQLVQKEWQKVPARETKAEHEQGFLKYFGVTRLMERIAQLEGDIDALIDIKQRDLTSAYHYYDIANILAGVKRFDEALQWAEKGYKKFSHDPDSRLTEFLIEEFQRREQHDKAIQLAWQQFTHQPRLADYRQLKACADKARAWKTWRGKALDHVRQTYLAGLKRERNKHWDWQPSGHSLLVEIFLWENELDSALTEARQGGCTEQLWFALARACENIHPAEALKIYQDRIGGIIGQTNNDAYDRAAEILGKIKKIMLQLKQQQQFKEYAGQLRTQYKQKRNFIKKIERI